MNNKLHILLADDDTDDRFFFGKAINLAATPSRLSTVENGERLMNFLRTNEAELPSALFLDLNMPKKNGAECLREIKLDERLREMPVIIYSTSLHEEIADILYEEGAHYYIKKASIADMQVVIDHVLQLITARVLKRPNRSGFVLNASSLLQ
jgi:CheY-like chemotaxis protein